MKQTEVPGNSIRPKVRVALVGAGSRTTSFLHYFSQHTSEGEIVALSDIIPEKGRLLARIYGVNAEVFDNTEKMVQQVKPDMIFICTPDYAHVETAVTALKAKIHVFCEKPMATTLEDCDTIINAAKKSPAVFYLGFNLRHDPVHETMHELIASGRLGKITTIEANEYYYGGKTYFRRWNRLQKFGGGLWITKACHDFDLLNWMAGAEPQTVYATANLSHYHSKPKAAKQCRKCELQYECPDYYDVFDTQSEEKGGLWREFRLTSEKFGKEPSDLCLFTSDKDTFDNGIAVVTYKNDIRTTYTVNVLASRSSREMRVIGTDGMAEADMEKGTIECTERHSKRKYTYDLSEMMKSGHGGSDDRMIKDFLHTCHTGKKPKSSWAEGRLAVEVALAARESCSTGKVIKF
ncbi:MAG: Gfo/Idh/MocA family oxidoreductase [Phycisphaerae bacterium]